MPPALLQRVARILETAADLVESGLVGYEADPDESAGLPSAFRRDVDLLCTMAGQEQAIVTETARAAASACSLSTSSTTSSSRRRVPDGWRVIAVRDGSEPMSVS